MGIVSQIKKVPTPVLIGGGGVILGVGYAIYRNKTQGAPVDEGAVAPDVAPVDAGYATDEYEVLGPSSEGMAAPVVVQPDTGETVGAVGQTALESLLGGYQSIFEGLPGLVEAAANAGGTAAPVVNVLPASPPPGTNKKPKPPVVQGPNKPAHYKPGLPPGGAGHIPAHATGWTELKTPDPDFRDFHVSFASGALVRWRHYADSKKVPKANRGKWVKIGETRWK